MAPIRDQVSGQLHLTHSGNAALRLTHAGAVELNVKLAVSFDTDSVPDTLEVHLHVDGPVTINVQDQASPRPAVGGRIVLEGGRNMADAQITVDVTNEQAKYEFVDDRGDVTAPPTGASCTWSSSDESVATVAPAASDPSGFTAAITPAGVGTVNVSLALANAADPAGNEIPDPSPVSLEIDAGAAVGGRIELVQA